MLDPLQVLKEARELGSTKTLAEIEAEIAKHDYPALREAERANFRIELWDKQSPINGVQPEQILDDERIQEVFLIYIDGKLTILQKFDPEQAGFVGMDANRALEAANAIVDALVEQRVDEKVKREVLRAVL